MDCERLRDFYEDYALGALEGDELAALEAHLSRGCASCTPGVRDARRVVSQLAYLAEPVTPPASVRRKLLAAASSPSKRARGISSSWAWGAVAASLVLALMFSMQQSRRLRKQASDLEKQVNALRFESENYRRAVSIAAATGTRAVVLVSTQPAAPRLRAFWSTKDGLLLLAERMPPPPSDRTYQLWVVPKAGKPISAGTFKPDLAGNVILISGPDAKAAEASALAITNEPEGGRPQPTTAPIWVGPLT